MFDKFREECGVFGIFDHPEAANLAYLGLYALQHRGQESAGIASADGHKIRIQRAMGYVADIFDEATLSGLTGRSAIGHVRYSTAGESHLQNAQPFLIECAHGQIAICHNGNLVNAHELRDDLVKQGSIFQTTSDTEVRAAPVRALARRFARRGADRVDRPGQRRLFAARDDEGLADRRARPARVQAARPRAPRRRPHRLQRDVRPRPDRRHLRA